MFKTAFNTKRLNDYQQQLGAMAFIELDYCEVQLLGMALRFLDLQLNAKRPQYLFADLCKHHVDELDRWLNNSTLRGELRFDAMNSVMWPIFSLENVRWLMLAMQQGVNSELIDTLAVEQADYEHDMEHFDGEWELYERASTNRHWKDSYASVYGYYKQIANYKRQVLDKFHRINIELNALSSYPSNQKEKALCKNLAD